MAEKEEEKKIENQSVEEIKTDDQSNEQKSLENNTKSTEESPAEEKPKVVKIRKPLDDQILESLFFLSGRPLTITRIALEFNWEPKEVRLLVKDLAKKLKKTKAELHLLEIQRDRWVLHFPLNDYSKEFKGILETVLIDYPKQNTHDKEVKRVLTAVAFHQPVSKQKLWRVLSTDNRVASEFTIVKLEQTLKLLTKEGLVRSNLKGSIQYKTTKAFSDEFGFDPIKINLKRQLVSRMEKKSKSKK